MTSDEIPAGEARSRPDLVRRVLDRARRDGFFGRRIALARLDQPVPAGYSCAGVVLAAGPEATEFLPGDLVACAGAGYASHAEVNYVPRNLAVHLPQTPSGQTMSFDEAAFATIGAIALHGVRLGALSSGTRRRHRSRPRRAARGTVLRAHRLPRRHRPGAGASSWPNSSGSRRRVARGCAVAQPRAARSRRRHRDHRRRGAAPR